MSNQQINREKKMIEEKMKTYTKMKIWNLWKD